MKIHPGEPQEKDRIPIGKLLRFGGIAILVVAVTILFAGWLARHSPEVAVASPDDTLERSLINVTAPGIDRRRAQSRALDQWRWVDKDAGIAQIPIERAIDLTVQKSEP